MTSSDGHGLPTPAGRAGAGGAVAKHARARSCVAVAGGGAVLVGLLGLPLRGSALPTIARRAVTGALPSWHTSEAVNALVYGTRGFDTLGETFLLVAAVVSVALVARSREPRPSAEATEHLGAAERSSISSGGGFPELDRTERREQVAEHDHGAGMTSIVRIGVHILLPVLAIAGVLVVACGYTPGGGFPGGVALAGVALLVYASQGLEALGPLRRLDVLEAVEVVAAVALLGLAVGGFVGRGSLTANYLPLGVAGTIQGGGVLQVFSGLELFEVTAGLLLVIVALLRAEHDWCGEGTG